MELTGYRVMDIYCPFAPEKSTAVKEAISSDTLDGPLGRSYPEPSFYRDGEREETKKRFKDFMENGIDVGPNQDLELWRLADCSFKWMRSSEAVYEKATWKFSTNPYVSFASYQTRRSSVQREPIPVQTLFRFFGPLRELWAPKMECFGYIQALTLCKRRGPGNLWSLKSNLSCTQPSACDPWYALG